MKSNLIILLMAYMVVFHGCKDEEFEPVYPNLITKPVITSQSDIAYCGGIIGLNGNVEILKKGVIWGTNKSLVLENCIGITNDGSGPTEYISSIPFLVYNIRYYARAYIITDSKTIFGGVVEFGIWKGPTAQTTGASNIRATSAYLSAFVAPNNSPTTAILELGTDTNYSEKIPLIISPVSGYNSFNLNVIKKGLQPNTVYHYRVTAENQTSKISGKDTSFKTKDIITDIEGNIYGIGQIGQQTWMLDNLRTDHYSNGELISNLQSDYYGDRSWVYTTSSETFNDYGRLYNYYTATDGRNICPTGWHVPSTDEVNLLNTYLGANAGSKLKITGNLHWASENLDATNLTDFTAMPAGYYYDNTFSKQGHECYLLTSTASSPMSAYTLFLSSTSSDINTKVVGKLWGYSIRCIKGTIPLIVAGNPDKVSDISAVVQCYFNLYNEPARIFLEYGKTEQLGNTIEVEPGEFNDSDTHNIKIQLRSLTPRAQYYYRFKAENNNGKMFSKLGNFTTLNAASAITYGVEIIAPGTVKLRGAVNPCNYPSKVTFVYGETTNYGEILFPENNLINGNESLYYEYILPNLPLNKTFHFAIRIESEVRGDLTGLNNSFTTSLVADYDNNKYGIIQIFGRDWMDRNLNTTRFSNGDIIPEISDPSEFISLQKPGWCHYGNSVLNGNIYGKLYNEAVITDARNVCPNGWHAAMKWDWEDLLGNRNNPLELLEMGTEHWNAPNNSNNFLGFKALPGGFRNEEGDFSIGASGNWWSYSFGEVFSYSMNQFGYTKNIVKEASSGFSIRCVKGNRPLLKNLQASQITSRSAIISGMVNPNGSNAEVYFKCDSKVFGLYKTVAPNPSIYYGYEVQDVSVEITDLQPDTEYFFTICSGFFQAKYVFFRTLPN